MVAKPISVRVAGAWVSVQDVPAAPSGATATLGDASASVSWTAPVNTGGIPITGYTVTSNPGNIQATTTGATAVNVPGLTNGTAYTFTVTATNAVGTSSASPASNSVTPQAITGQLYINPASGSYSVNGSVVVTIRENSYTTDVNSFQANITYDDTMLQFVSSDVSTSPFTSNVQNTGGSGTVQVSSADLSGSQTGDQVVSVVTFTALAAGTTTIAFDTSTSGIADTANSSNICNSFVGASLTIS